MMQMYVLKQQKHKNVTYSEQGNSLKVAENTITTLSQYTTVVPEIEFFNFLVEILRYQVFRTMIESLTRLKLNLESKNYFTIISHNCKCYRNIFPAK